MLIVEQTLTCDICGEVMCKLNFSVQPGQAIQQTSRPNNGVGSWKDVCSDCIGHLTKAFWAVKAAAKGCE